MRVPYAIVERMNNRSRGNTTSKWSISDAKKDVGIKNVENKGFPDAINTASGDASGKHSFPTHQEGVGKFSSEKELKSRGEKRGEAERGKERSVVVSVAIPPLFCRCPSPPSATLGSSSQQTTPTHRRRAQSRLLELERHVAINWWADIGREYTEVVKGDLQRLFVLDFNDQAMNGFVEHQMLTTFKEFRADSHRHFKKYSDPEEAHANPPNALVGRDEDWSNHGRTRLLGRSSLTFIVASPSRFYNDSMSSLKEKESRSIMWNCFGKHTFELGHSCHRPPRMRIIKCWNSNISLPQRVVSHSLRMRYAIRCWVDDQATQKALVGDSSRRPAERRVQAVRRHFVRSP
ncbi:NBS-LRR type resistance protein [Cucumis melo var. makuwa]|uniref:NBS-LRR type resistance protein n=1 Tax=Cucumis melo var. makuwa TaxID=1194695 RepID=A0A5A7USQ8_CUCMM|nr:NBS-LRR type resistance protein [Cucumis melo var. makuwa]TYK11006.1 NBS-LRR type resistance protein [Cucumis melo var. makuwa]